MSGDVTSSSESCPRPSGSLGKESLPRRLGKNKGRYCGETIDIHHLLEETLSFAKDCGWEVEHLPCNKDEFLPVLWRRRHSSEGPNVYLSTGIHGDEPAGPLAIRNMIRQNRWPAGLNLWICPCLNPTGFPMSSRENVHGWDLNRDYRHLRTPEVATHVQWLKTLPEFDLTLCLHEDWESDGFYLYELNPDSKPSMAQTMIDAVSAICPIDHSATIEDRPAKGGVIRPDHLPDSRPDWPEAFYLIHNKTRLSYTLEAPSDFELPIRVRALEKAVNACLGKV